MSGADDSDFIIGARAGEAATSGDEAAAAALLMPILGDRGPLAAAALALGPGAEAIAGLLGILSDAELLEATDGFEQMASNIVMLADMCRAEVTRRGCR